MKLILNDKGLISERYLRQAIYFIEYARRDINMSFLLQCVQLELILLWSRHSFVKQVPLIKKEFLQTFSIHEQPSPDVHKLEALLKQLDQFGYIKYYPAKKLGQPDRFTLIPLLKVRAYAQLVWKGQTFRGIKSLKKSMQLNSHLAIDGQGLRMAASRSPFAPPFTHVKELFSQYNYPLKMAVAFYQHCQYNDWIHAGITLYTWKRFAHLWMKKSMKRTGPDQLKT